MSKQSKILLELFATFFRIGMFTFGGGFAMIPLIQRELVQKRRWLTEGYFTDSLSLTQSVPGAVAINMAIFSGYKIAGGLGALTCAFAVSLPSLIIIIAIATGLRQFVDHPLVDSVFRGVRPAVVGLIIYAAWELGRKIEWSRILAVVFALTFVLNGIFGLNAAYLIILNGGIGLLLYNRSKLSRAPIHPGKMEGRS